jgi:hypothetical protein
MITHGSEHMRRLALMHRYGIVQVSKYRYLVLHYAGARTVYDKTPAAPTFASTFDVAFGPASEADCGAWLKDRVGSYLDATRKESGS